MDLENVKNLLQKCCEELSLQLVSIRFYHDSEMGDVLEVLIDKDYSITMKEIEEFTDKVNPLLDELPELSMPYTLDISSGGSMREIPFEDAKKFVDDYLEIQLSHTHEKITVKVLSFEGDELTAMYFIKGRKKKLVLKKEDVESIHMGYKA